ncbi:membrane-bound PQQ-dependent dehydrogenase, glucose/quinate/shikimate family [Pseudomonas veronii]
MDNLRGLGKYANSIFLLIVLVAGVILAIGGVMLMSLGGSYYYLITGVGFILAAGLMWRGSAWGGWIYAAALLWTLAWALAIGGIDFWGLLGRLAFPFILGLWLLTPWFRRSIITGPASLAAGRVAVVGLFALLLVVIVIGFVQGDNFETVAVGTLPPAEKMNLDGNDWQVYGKDQAGTRFSSLDQINSSSVKNLEEAWTYHTGDYPPPDKGKNRRLEVTPLKIADTLYLCTPRSDIVALDAETGKVRWRHNTSSNLTGISGSVACRGVAYYELPGAGGRSSPSACATRIYSPTVDARLVAVDAMTGESCHDFGDKGVIDLKRGLGDLIPGYALVSSAPLVVRGKLVIGGWITDGQFVGEPGGVIRAYDALNGKFSWAYDPGNPNKRTEPAEGQSYVRGTPNSWAPGSGDEQLGLVYLPTGNAGPDYFGAHRSPESEAFASSVVALDVETGDKRWLFQTTHHDVWDYDVGSQPTLIDLDINGQKTPALLQPTKRGQVFVLDRRTGKPLSEVKELPVPQENAVPEERLAATQPFSSAMPAFDGYQFPFNENSMWGVTPFDEMLCRIKFKQARFNGPMTNPGLDNYITMPGSLGGMNWGGVSVDPERKLMVVNWSRVAMYNRLIPRAEADAIGLKPDIGAGADVAGGVPQAGTPYAADISPFMSIFGAPCLNPPYGLVTAVDLNTKKVVWSKRLDNAYDSGLFGITSHLPIPMGSPNLGGSLTTRGGLVFISGGQELSLRAMDLRTGNVLWRGRLPAGGQATPMTYLSPQSGDQFVVIAAGGHNLMLTQPGDAIVAYKLKK